MGVWPTLTVRGGFQALATRLCAVAHRGVGVELQVSMDLVRYDQAATAILAVFLMVVAVEQLGSALRRRLC